MKLSDAQIRWLDDPRPYFNIHTSRTGRALVRHGIIKITEENYSNGKCGYEITDAGRTALAPRPQERKSRT